MGAGWRVIEGDCVQLMAEMPENSIDAIVCDPPYGIGFMGKTWDALPPGIEWARACLRVLKPGGHLIAFGGQRTVHRLVCALEDAGFDVRDLGAWQYWSGFPKSLDVSKAIDAAAGAEREVVGRPANAAARDRYAEKAATTLGTVSNTIQGAGGYITAPATDDARKWQGWGTALKPCLEPWTLCRKPLSERAVAANVLRWGTGGLNIDACRYAYGDPAWPGPQDDQGGWGGGGSALHEGGLSRTGGPARPASGRWPANVYVCPKPSTAEREQGCGHLARATAAELVGRTAGTAGMESPRAGAGRTSNGRGNTHATVQARDTTGRACP
jgi:hypothetical protein